MTVSVGTVFWVGFAIGMCSMFALLVLIAWISSRK